MLKTKPEFEKIARAVLLAHTEDLDAMGLPEDELELFGKAVEHLAEEFDAAVTDRWIEFRDACKKAQAPKSGMMISAEQG